MSNYQLYPEINNPGITMADVPHEAFTLHTVTDHDGQQYTLLHSQSWPYSVLQVHTCTDLHDFRKALNAAQQQGWAEYVEGHTDHIVIHRGNWQHVELNQANAQQMADQIHDDIRNAARWWCLYKPLLTSPKERNF